MLEQEPRWVANIGWIKPGPVSKTLDHFFRLTPPDVNFIISTTTWSLRLTNVERFDQASLPNALETMVAAAQDLMNYEELDFLAVTGDLLQSALGLAWNQALRAALEDATGKPAATAMTAATDALRAMGVTRPLVVTPVGEAKNEDVRAYLEASGLDVAAIQGVPTRSTQEIKALPPTAPYDMAQSAFGEASGADGIYIMSVRWRSTEFAERLERELGVPVITNFGSLIWRALTAIGYPSPVRGYGRLLGSIARPPS
jgi:maleate cis-trans isomerase